MKKSIIALVALLMLSSPSFAHQTILTSWYYEGRVTANGERFNPDGLTAAHRTLPFGTILKVTYKGKSVIVRINDRGPFIKGRSLDLSRGAAKALGCYKQGVCRVEIEVIKLGKKKRHHS